MTPVRFSASIPLTSPYFSASEISRAAHFGASPADRASIAQTPNPTRKIQVKEPGLLNKIGAFFKLLFTLRIFRDKQKLMASAAEENNLKLLTTLLNYGVNPDFEYEGKVPLVVLAAREPKEAIEGISLLLSYGARINLQNSSHINALAQTILDDHYETFAFLLENGASPDGTTVRDFTPARLALNLGRRQMLSDLVTAGADLTQPDSQGQTILDDIAHFEALQKQDFEAMKAEITQNFKKQSQPEKKSESS